MTCLSGDVANPSPITTDERLVLWPESGAVASLAAMGEDCLDKAFQVEGAECERLVTMLRIDAGKETPPESWVSGKLINQQPGDTTDAMTPSL